MNGLRKQRCDLYYTSDHEWIDFQGSIAYVGIGPFKLKGIKAIHKIAVDGASGAKKKGDRIATIQFEDYRINVHMPVNGKVINYNDLVLDHQQNLLLDQPERNGWIALIIPDEVYERKGLLHPEEYKRLIGKRNL